MQLPEHTRLVYSRADLRAMGMRPKQITRAVRAGHLIRARRDHYLFERAGRVDEAVRVGGLLSCVSLLSMLGAFVLDDGSLHVQLDPRMSRLRGPAEPRRPITEADRRGLTLHWCSSETPASNGIAPLMDAAALAVRCQSPRAAIAMLDSLLFLGLISEVDLADVFGRLPDRFGSLRPLLDARCESGPESLVRLMLRQMGVDFDLQVEISGVGRVDFVVDGWLIIECDSRAHHEGWSKQRRDRKRDMAAAARGFVTFRPLAEDIMHRPDDVRAAILGLLRSHGR